MVKKSKVKYINIKLLPTELFQIPFHPQQIERYKGFGGYNYFDCLFHVLFVLKLRLYKQCHEDSIKMCKNKLNGVEINDTAKYLSSIFETPIERFINYDAEFSFLVISFEVLSKSSSSSFLIFMLAFN